MTLGVSQVDVDAPALFSRPAFETLGAIPDICKGVMYYQALNCTSKLFLAFGHLAIRVDEWPDESFPWPMQFDHDQIPDVWIPQSSEATVLKAVKLQPAKEPIRRPPHADIDHGSSEMAEQLEVSHDEFLGASLQCETDGPDVRGHGHETSSEGCHAGHVLPSSDCHDNAEDRHSSTDAEESAGGIPQRPGEVRSSSWASKLWRWRQGHQDLRPMWRPVDGEHRQGQVPGAVPTKSFAHGKDTFGPSKGDRPQDWVCPTPRRSGAPTSSTTAPTTIHPTDQPNKPDKSHGVAVKGVSKFLGWLATIAVAFNESGQGQEPTCSSAYIGQTHRAEPGVVGGGRCEHGQLGAASTEFGLLTQHGGSRTRAFSSPGRGHVAEPSSKPPGGGSFARGADTGRARRASMADKSHPPDRWGEFRRGRGGRGRSLDGLRLHDKVCQHDGDRPHSAEHQHEPLGPNALRGSPDEPLLKEDRGWQQLRSGQQKRLLGTIRSLRKCLTVETQLYAQQAARARAMRRHRCDLLEVYGGFANISI